ncbi:hypothetical protein Tco_0697580 [Tanacetum coccineum]
MHADVQLNYVVDSHADYMSDSNMIPYDQYVKDNAVPVVQSNVSSIPNDAYMMILNDMHEQSAQYDLIKMKSDALKEQTVASRPVKALTVYPPSTPTTLVPRVLPTKMNRKYDEIEQKNLLIANDNLIADCLSKDVFYIATNSKLTVSRFTEMHDAHTVVQAHCLELEAKLYKLHDKFKVSNLKIQFGNNTFLPARDAPDFDSVFVIEKMKASIQGKDNAIKKLRMQISQLKDSRSEADRTLDFRALDF